MVFKIYNISPKTPQTCILEIKQWNRTAQVNPQIKYQNSSEIKKFKKLLCANIQSGGTLSLPSPRSTSYTFAAPPSAWMHARSRPWRSRSILWKCNLFSCLPSPLASTEIESQQANPVMRRARETSHQSRRKSARRRATSLLQLCTKRQKIGNLSFHFRSAGVRHSLGCIPGDEPTRDGEMLKCEADAPTDWESAMFANDVAAVHIDLLRRVIEARIKHTHIYTPLPILSCVCACWVRCTGCHMGCLNYWRAAGGTANYDAACSVFQHQPPGSRRSSQPALCAMPTRPKTLVRDALVAGASTPTHPFPSCTPLLICRANLLRSQRSTPCTAALLYTFGCMRDCDSKCVPRAFMPSFTWPFSNHTKLFNPFPRSKLACRFFLLIHQSFKCGVVKKRWKFHREFSKTCFTVECWFWKSRRFNLESVH